MRKILTERDHIDVLLKMIFRRQDISEATRIDLISALAKFSALVYTVFPESSHKSTNSR